jgi:pyrrolysyl-tRNA synthetase-like protein
MVENANTKRVAKRYYRKKTDLFSLLTKIKLWPSRTGILHGISTLLITGESATVTTHCGKSFKIKNSRNSRAARWLRNKYYQNACKHCQVPEWKLQKYGETFFSPYGESLKKAAP